MWFLGIDIGTTHIKVVGLTEDGVVLPAARRRTPVLSIGAHSFHDSETFWDVTADLITEYAHSTADRYGALAGISVGTFGQEESVAIDRSGRLIYPSLVWWENRAEASLGKKAADYLDSFDHYAISGMRYRMNQSPERLAYIREHEPHIWAQMDKWVDFGSYITWKLTGEWVASVTQVTHSQFFDLAGMQPHRPSMELLGIGPDLFPPAVETGACAGAIRREVLSGVDIAHNACVYVGGHDQVLASYAVQGDQPTNVFDSIGSSEYLMVLSDIYAPARIAYERGMDYERSWRPGEYVIGSAVPSGKIIQLLANLFFASDFDRMFAALGDVAAPPSLKMSISTLSGPGGGLITLADLPADASPAEVVRACFDQLADHAREALAQMCEIGRTDPRSVTLMGSLFKRDEMVRHRRECWRLPLHVSDIAEPVATGAAMIAREATLSTGGK